ncbi:MAG TPA: hemerythrin domain-containing protein [Micromonosporaceae bacterium]
MTLADESATTGDRDVIAVLIEDHREVEQMFSELESGTGDPEHRRQVANAVIAELVRHSVAEEEYLYPVTRDVLPDGDRIADEEIREHAQAERTMKEIEGVDATDARFDEMLGSLMAEIRHHIAEEENMLFPRLRETCPPERLMELGRKVETAKKMAPTRPHPSAPDTPPWDKLLGPGVGLIDRVRDALSGRATSMEQAREKK